VSLTTVVCSVCRPDGSDYQFVCQVASSVNPLLIVLQQSIE